MNDFMTLAKSRYSVRSYQSRPVEQEKIEKILEAARIAPTAWFLSRWATMWRAAAPMKKKRYARR